MFYGKYIVENLKRDVKKPTKTIQCIDCGEWFEVKNKARKSCRCNDCQRKNRLKYKDGFKTIQCVDCKISFTISSKSRSCRCDNCRTARKKFLKKEYKLQKK